MDPFLVQSHQTWVLIGDSITDAGRREEHAPYGWGYVRLVIEAVTARYPERRIAYHNRGIGGNTVADLRQRWQQDALALEPDWVSILIGINDLHRTLGNEPTAVPPDRYQRLYREILDLTRKRTSAQIVLLDPFYMSVESDPQRWEGTVLRRLDDYLAAVGQLAEDYRALHVRTHDLFQRQLEHRPASTFCPEPVHPNSAGHMVIAHGLLNVLNW